MGSRITAGPTNSSNFSQVNTTYCLCAVVVLLLLLGKTVMTPLHREKTHVFLYFFLSHLFIPSVLSLSLLPGRRCHPDPGSTGRRTSAPPSVRGPFLHFSRRKLSFVLSSTSDEMRLPISASGNNQNRAIPAQLCVYLPTKCTS